MTDLAPFTMPDSVFAAIHGAKDKEAKLATFAEAFSRPVCDIRDVYAELASQFELSELRSKFTSSVGNSDVPKSILAKLVEAETLGLTLKLVVHEIDADTGEPSKGRLMAFDASAVTTSKGGKPKGSRWTYTFRGKKFLKFQLTEQEQSKQSCYTSLKAHLKELAKTNDATGKLATIALAIQDNPHKADPKRWGTETNLNSWQALQAVPGLATLYGRSR